MKSMKRPKDATLKDESPRSEGVQQATGEEHRVITNSSRKNEVAGSKRKRQSVVDHSGGDSKSDEQYIAQEHGMLGPSVKVNWTWSSEQESLKCSTWVQSQKQQDVLGLFPRQTNITAIQICASAANAEKLKLTSSLKTYKTFQNSHQKKMSFSSLEIGMQKQEVKRYLK